MKSTVEAVAQTAAIRDTFGETAALEQADDEEGRCGQGKDGQVPQT